MSQITKTSSLRQQLLAQFITSRFYNIKVCKNKTEILEYPEDFKVGIQAKTETHVFNNSCNEIKINNTLLPNDNSLMVII